MKAAPLMRQLAKYPEKFKPFLIHTGQHYDHNLSQLFFEQLKMPQPDKYLGVGSGTHAEQTGKIMIELEKTFAEIEPDLVVVFGDVNSTMAGAIVAKKMQVELAHVEAGLRSFDMDMPEEVNRIVTDRIADYHFISEDSGMKNLMAEGMQEKSLFRVGNIMIDSLVGNLEAAQRSDIVKKLGLAENNFVLMTMHRPTNVDSEMALRPLIDSIVHISERIPVVFPCHPRTEKKMEMFDLAVASSNNLKLIEPLGYLDFLKLQSEAKLVLTDSGGIQEETTYLKIPCVTMRKNTERPATVEIGSNVVAGIEPDKIVDCVLEILDGNIKSGSVPELWDGRTAERIVDILIAIYK
jgi:UDP-N-acetylglucosamine 2-epimerase (non-hydrolysing)